MVAFVAADGTAEYFRDSTGSNSDTDINLMASWLLLPSVVLRAARAGRRPWIFEIAIAAAALWIVVEAVPWASLRQTIGGPGDVWLVVYAVALPSFAAGFILAALVGWVLGMRAGGA
jgi:hypothetical protein